MYYDYVQYYYSMTSERGWIQKKRVMASYEEGQRSREVEVDQFFWMLLCV